MHCRALSRSKYFAVTDPGIIGMKGVLYCSLAVRDRAPIVRPWKAPEKQTTSVAALLSVLYGSSPAVRAADLKTVHGQLGDLQDLVHHDLAKCIFWAHVLQMMH